MDKFICPAFCSQTMFKPVFSVMLSQFLSTTIRSCGLKERASDSYSLGTKRLRIKSCSRQTFFLLKNMFSSLTRSGWMELSRHDEVVSNPNKPLCQLYLVICGCLKSICSLY